MTENIINAIIMINTWGDDSGIIGDLKSDRNVISLYHIMGRHSYLLDVNFDDKKQLEQWVGRVKAMSLPSGVPAVISIQTQKIIEVHKKKEDFSLARYLEMKEKSHFFVQIDCPQYTKGLLVLMKKSPIIRSIVHIQGENSFTIEAIAESYKEYTKMLKRLKKLKKIKHIETQEVISVIKYRNQILDEKGGPVYPKDDIRELYTL